MLRDLTGYRSRKYNFSSVFNYLLGPSKGHIRIQSWGTFLDAVTGHFMSLLTNCSARRNATLDLVLSDEQDQIQNFIMETLCNSVHNILRVNTPTWTTKANPHSCAKFQKKQSEEACSKETKRNNYENQIFIRSMQATEEHNIPKKNISMHFLSGKAWEKGKKAGCWETPTLKITEGQNNTGEREQSSIMFFFCLVTHLHPLVTNTP